MTETKENKKNTALTGYLAVAGAVSMFAGAACWGATGTDIWGALAAHQMDQHLEQLSAAKQLLAANTTFWIIGVLLMGAAGKRMASHCHTKPGLAEVAASCIQSAVPVAIVAFIAMFSLVVHQPDTETAYVIGWIGARLDDLATLLIVGVFPLIISTAGRPDWVPRWLSIHGVLAGLAGLLAVVAIFTGIVPLGFIIIPVGLGWMIAAGLVLIRAKK
ncbi:MAG: hypothetical protein R2792_09565 [Saprospiraceae bacterium]|jgi:hypothetical protein